LAAKSFQNHKALKEHVGKFGEVSFVDFEAEGDFAFVRMGSQADAAKLVEGAAGDELGSAALLAGEEEETYWKKVRDGKAARAQGKKQDDGTYVCSVCKESLPGTCFTITQLNKVNGKVYGKRKAKPLKCLKCIEAKEAETRQKDVSKLTCQVCNEVFSSRNQLFKHIRDAGHDGEKKESDDTAAPAAKKAKLEETATADASVEDASASS